MVVVSPSAEGAVQQHASLFRSPFPLVAFRSPFDVASEHPSFLAAELNFHALLLVTIYDSFFKRGKGNGSDDGAARHLWIAALFSGASVELLTIMLNEVGNFYHSISTVSLFGYREPAYMLFGCYVFCQYVPIMLARKMNLAWAPRVELRPYSATVYGECSTLLA